MTAAPQAPHAPVMRDEVVAAMAPQDGEVLVDGTLGAGGYSRALLDAADCAVIGFDRDPQALSMAADWGAVYGDRLRVVESAFGDMEAALNDAGVEAIDAAVFDIGVSSMQLDEAARGFSFRQDGPLSMRMDSRADEDAVTAADVVNHASAGDLALMFKVYGEERHAGRISRAIEKARANGPITTTAQLARIVEDAQPAGPPAKIHPATRVFQAIRIYVNDELGELARALVACEKLLRPGGRLVVVTFHSLEDRLVKHFLKDRATKPGAGGSRYAPPKDGPARRVT